MSFDSSAAAMCLVLFGFVLLFVSLRREKKTKYLNKYLIKKGKDQNHPEKLLDWLDTVIPNSLTKNQAEVTQKLNDAGVYSFKYAYLYLPLKFAVLFIGGVVIAMATHATLELTIRIAVIAFWIIVILIVPDAVMDARVKKYRSDMTRQLPYLIDLLAVCVQTGMTIESSMGYLAKEMKGFDAKLARLLERTNERAHIVGLDKALDELYVHIPTSEMRSFVMTLKQSLQYGSSIYSTLTTLSADIRKVTMLNIEEKIGQLAAKMSIPLILFIMVPIVILIAAPGVMRMMSGG
ncbi:type II secretion system F family protein [Vibrio renipiscarius]|uniref:Biotin synthase n=1 Tax=Vibrio renipiscarius TaxID=1461322 RepID=A0A0C2NI32_9VIBR|nr:type II secretion system F family protein [Vibrio renipiscarius]KII76010.1 biotin synthase [Vibrio renipiscarius]KII79114.1 biotin synthase [Vibrio renipiscarius]